MLDKIYCSLLSSFDLHQFSNKNNRLLNRNKLEHIIMYETYNDVSSLSSFVLWSLKEVFGPSSTAVKCAQECSFQLPNFCLKTQKLYILRLLTQYIIFLPSCIVFLDSIVLLGPSPTEVNADTSNSYSVYSSSPVTTFVRVDPLLIVIWVDDPDEPFLL